MNKSNNIPDTTYICATGGIGGAGKDFTIDSILSFLPGVASIDKNATTLKEIVNVAIYELFKEDILTHNPINDDSCTSSQFQKPMFSDKDFEDLKNNNSYKLPFDGNLSVREVLQVLGTDVIRSISTDFHIKMLARRVSSSTSQFIFVTDSRFSNEYNFVKEFNKKPDDEKHDFLNSISLFERNGLPTQEDLKIQIETLFGTNKFSTSIHTLLSDCFYDENYLVDVYSDTHNQHNQLLLNEHVYSHNFTNELKSGALFVLRDSTRDLPNHSSEKHNTDIIESIPASPELSVFNNATTPITDNIQFKQIIEFLIIKSALNFYNKNELLLSDDIIMNTDLPSSISSLSKILSTAKSVPTELLKMIDIYESTFNDMPNPKKTISNEKIQSK